ncbi:hypothetical protein [Alkalibacterium gilvum]|uniref:hypothetical protein n=1 Tax=Alkalibacterium gilvum TaxID=1130080 RepID=UPI003F93BD35
MDKDSPLAFNNLSEYDQEALMAWCKSLNRIQSTNNLHDTYSLKHLFARKHFYITNGALKGALLLAGFTPADMNQLNWRFNISERSLKKEYRAIGVIC